MCRNISELIGALLVGIAFSANADASMMQEPQASFTVRDLATLRDLSGLTVSPDGRVAAFAISRGNPDQNRYDISWHIIEIASADSRQAADGGELMPVAHNRNWIAEFDLPPAPIWSPDGDWFAFLRRENGTTQLWRARRDGRRSEQLTHGASDVRSSVYAADGTRILFQTTRSQAEVSAALNAEGLSGHRYDDRAYPIYGSTPASPLAPEPAPSARMRVYDLAVRRERAATAAEEIEFATLSQTRLRERRGRGNALASPGGALAWTEARDPARQGAYPPLTVVAQSPDASEPVICAAAQCTSARVEGLWWRSDQELVFMVREGDRLEDRGLYAWRPFEQVAPRLILRTADYIPSDERCTLVRLQLLCFLEQADRARRLVSIDLDDGDIHTLFDPNPDLARFNLGRSPQRIQIRAGSGAETFGYLVLPPNYRPGERLPLVIVTYRCYGFLRGGVGDEYPIFPFAAEGFAVLCYELPDNIELQAQQDAASFNRWMRGSGLPMRRRVEETLDAAIAQLDGMGIIDPDRVGITGLSYGAEIVGFALPHMPRLAAAISSGSPGKGPAIYPFLSPLARELNRSWGLGAPEQTPEAWRQVGFTPHANRVRAPLLINVSDHEFLFALPAVSALQELGRAVDLYVFPGEYHVKWQPAHRLAIYNRNIDWMNFWLRGVESGLTGNPAQYGHWRTMRDNQCRLFGPEGTQRGVRLRDGERLTDEELFPWYCRPGAIGSTAN